KCLMHAMLEQLSPKTVVTRAQKIAESSSALLTTTIPQQDLDVFMDLALKARNRDVALVSRVLLQINTGDPAHDKGDSLLSDALSAAEGRKVNNGGITNVSLPELEAPTAEDLAKDPRKAGNTEDLNSSC